MLRALLLLGRAGEPGRGLGGRRCHALTARRIDSLRISLASSIDELWPCNSFSFSVAKVIALSTTSRRYGSVGSMSLTEKD